jgi:hypothetical protein
VARQPILFSSCAEAGSFRGCTGPPNTTTSTLITEYQSSLSVK